MSWELWPKTDDKGLARYVLPDAAAELRVPALPTTLPQDPASRRALAAAIYAALVDKRIVYRPEDYQPDLDRQTIRHPSVILDGPKMGTCLDLAVLFCGICLGHDLLPLLIVLDDHAFAAVSLQHNRRDWESHTRLERAVFLEGVLRGDAAGKSDELKQLLDERSFLPIECTGFSRAVNLKRRSPEWQGREGEFLPFDRAIAAAREHLEKTERQLRFAIDVASLHFNGYQPPPPWGALQAPTSIEVYAGPNAQRVDYARETADIVQYYTSRFVGRDEELNAVFDFVRGAGPPGAGAYLLIEAPGGFGKSAFMVQLLVRAQTGQWSGATPHTVYFFVRRPGRNTPEAFLQAINSQLMAHLGVSGGTPLLLTELKAQFSQLWAAIESAASADAPLLLLVDGLDEMARAVSDSGETIAELLPTPTNRSIRVVVSSRPQPPAREQVRREHPLRAAGLVELRTFDLAGVQRLLESVLAGSKPRARRITSLTEAELVALADRIHKLTNGEPLFARFACEQLVDEGVEVLEKLERDPPKDVEEYFRRELKALRDAAATDEVWSILGLLCAAAGPLSRNEIAGILKQPPRRIDPEMAAIDRFLLGEQRFELMHPRLRDLVSSELSDDERESATKRILDWCASYRDQGWPDSTPAYALDYYAAQLAAIGDRTGLFALLDQRWMRRHRARDGKGTLSGFVRDAALATDVALRGPDYDWMAAFRGAFILATMRSLAAQLPPSIIAFLAHAGEVDEALGYAELVTDPIQRCEVFARLAQVALERGDESEARRRCRTALEALIGDAELLGELEPAYAPLCAVLADLRDSAGLGVALKAAEHLERPEDWSAGALAAIAAAYSRLACPEPVRALLRTYPGKHRFLERASDLALEYEDDALLRAIVDNGVGDDDVIQMAVVAGAHQSLGEPSQARAIAEEAIAKVRARNDPGLGAGLLVRFFKHGLKDGTEEVRAFLQSAALNFEDDPELPGSNLQAVIRAWATVGDSSGLRAVETGISLRFGDEVPDEIRATLAWSHARLGSPELAKAAARSLESEESDGSYEAIAWQHIVEGLRDAGRLDEAIQAALENKYESRAQGLAVVVEALGKSEGGQARALELARRTIVDASGMAGEQGQAEAYADLSSALSERDERDRALPILDRAEAEVASVPSGGLTLETVRPLVVAQARLGRFEQADARRGGWKDDAGLLELFLELARAAGRKDLVARLERELQNLASSEEPETLLVAARIARSTGQSADAKAWLERALLAVSKEDAIFRFSNLCAVLIAAGSAGEQTTADRALQMLQSTPEWSALTGDESTPGTPTEAANVDNEEAPWAGAVHALTLAEAMHHLGRDEESLLLLERWLAMAKVVDSIWIPANAIEQLSSLLAEHGQLRQRSEEIVFLAERQPIGWILVDALTGIACIAQQWGETEWCKDLIARALTIAARDGRLAFFGLVSRLSGNLSTFGSPDLEWTLFQMCEQVDAWWQPA